MRLLHPLWENIENCVKGAWIGLLGLCAFRITAQTNDVPEANPARPTVSTPATLPPVGYLQFETGTLGASTSPEFSTRIGINQVTRLAVTRRFDLFSITEPYVHAAIGTAKKIGPGEVFLGAQAVLVAGQGASPTISVSYIRRLYESPVPELDLGTFRESGLLLVSDDLVGFHFDGNLIVTEQTAHGVRRAQNGQTLSISHPLRKLTISGEFWTFSQPFLASRAIGILWSASYPLRRNLVIDAGFDHGVTATSTHWEGFAGFTYVLPRRLWRE
jgi:hypothetical protein